MSESLELGDPWRVCFESAWEAFRAGTIPVGAAVTSADGAIVARGRNQSAFWQEHSERPVAPEIITAFGEDARIAGRRVIEHKDALPVEFDEALPHLVDAL